VDLELTPSLASVGGSAKYSVQYADGRKVKLMLLHPDPQWILALENRCTHGKREINYRPDENRLVCSSFGRSGYDLEGHVQKGPAKSDLKSYPVRLSGSIVEVDLA
jgi:nitrite reductase/ring-hydroxylating ferredoxin subunit